MIATRSMSASAQPSSRSSRKVSATGSSRAIVVRSIGFNVQGVRLAVHRITGEIVPLQSVHAADIGRTINPMQCRGQIDGAVAMGFGWALTEKMVYDGNGVLLNPALRDYRIPASRRCSTSALTWVARIW